MNKYNIEFLPIAYKDIEDIFEYIFLYNQKEANNIINKIMDNIKILEEFPMSGKELIHPLFNYYNFRMLIIDSYIAFYRIIDNTIYIYRILHGAMDYLKALDN